MSTPSSTTVSTPGSTTVSTLGSTTVNAPGSSEEEEKKEEIVTEEEYQSSFSTVENFVHQNTEIFGPKIVGNLFFMNGVGQA